MNRGSANPFTTTFGKIPEEYISRNVSTSLIIDDFSSQPSPNQIYILTGVRGSGKSVCMSKIEEYFMQQDEWIVIELSTTWDMLEELASQLENRRKSVSLSLSVSTPVGGVSVEKKMKGVTANTRIINQLERIKKENRRLLIAADEVVNNTYVRQFASAFQIYLKQYPVYLIMTGLYENVRDLKDEKNLTFLYRAPMENLMPLNRKAIAEKYKTIFELSEEEAFRMADITKGYPYAFQVLGSLYWTEGMEKPFEAILNDLDDWLSRYVYSKIWSELSKTDQQVIRAIIDCNTSEVTMIRKHLGMSSGKFGVYRKRLLEKQLIVSSAYGEIQLALPRFDVFVRNQYFE